MKKRLTIVFYLFLLGTVGILGYGIINWLVFLNVVEEQLPESKEKIPDLGIVENTDLDEDNE